MKSNSSSSFEIKDQLSSNSTDEITRDEFTIVIESKSDQVSNSADLSCNEKLTSSLKHSSASHLPTTLPPPPPAPSIPDLLLSSSTPPPPPPPLGVPAPPAPPFPSMSGAVPPPPPPPFGLNNQTVTRAIMRKKHNPKEEMKNLFWNRIQYFK
jgi:hypothetical protein